MNSLMALLLLATATLFSQEREPLAGLVLSNNMAVANIFVINKVTGTEVKANANGIFTIPSKPGDVIVVYSPNTKVREFAISDASFKESPYIVEVEISALELDEVVVDGTITGEKLGIVPANQKQFTPAERRLYTAGDFKPIMLLGLLAGGMPFDPVLNAINGRTKKMKKQVALEKREKLLQNLHNICNANEITNNLKIPEEHINGFLYFVTEDKEVAPLLSLNNKSRAKFRIVVLAQKYLDLLKDE